MKTDDELIAEFMGFEIIDLGVSVDDTKTPIYKILDNKGNPMHPYYGGHRGEQMQFNRSWDWLMPVVEKIEDMGFSTKIEFNTVSTTVTIGNMSVWENPSTKIAKVYKAVVEFIKWYNQQNP